MFVQINVVSLIIVFITMILIGEISFFIEAANPIYGFIVRLS